MNLQKNLIKIRDMKTENQNSVRSLFSLPPEEKIFDDFKCSLGERFSLRGKFYLTENFICFNSSIFGIKIKLVIPFIEIKEIKKVFNTIQIVFNTNNTNNKIHKKTFSSFINIDIIYKRIKLVYKNYLLKHKDNNIHENSTKENFINMNDDSDNNDDENESDFDEHNISTGSVSISSKSNISSENERSFSKSGNDSNCQSDCGKEFSKIPNTSDITINFQEINEEQNIAIKHVINMSVNNFYQKYFGNPSESNSSFLTFYSSLSNHSNVNVSKWEKTDNKCDNVSSPNTFQRTLTFQIKVEGLPLIHESNCTKIQTLTVFNENSKNPELKYVIRGSAVSTGVPLSSYFTVEDQFELYSYMNGSQTVLRVIFWNKIIKSTFFKTLILNSTKKVYLEESESFINFIKTNGDSILPYVPIVIKHKKSNNNTQISKLTHGIEKEKKEMVIEQKETKKYYKIISFVKRLFNNTLSLIIFLLVLLILFLIFIIFLQLRNSKLINENINLKEYIKQLLLLNHNQTVPSNYVKYKSNF